MKYFFRTLSLLSLASLASVAGCFSLSHGAPLPRQYALGAERLKAGDPKPLAAGVTVGIRRVELEPYLDTPLLVLRKGSREITFLEFQRWAEPLGTGIGGTLARYLAGRAPIRHVDSAPWPSRAHYDFVIQLHVLRFEGEQPELSPLAAAEAHVLVAWEIVRQDDGVVVAQATTDYRKGGSRAGDYDGLVAQLDEGLIVLADALVAKLGELAARPPGSD